MTRPSAFMVLAISLFFVAAGIGMVATGSEGGWPALLFFGVCAAVAVWQLWPSLIERREARVEDLLTAYPGPLELRASPAKHLFLVLASGIFAGTCAWMAWRSEGGTFLNAVLLLGAAFFGFGSLVSLALVVRGGALVLGEEGFKLLHWGRPRVVRWRDVGAFQVAEVPPSATLMVAFDDAAVADMALAKTNSALIGVNSALPDTYGLSHADLVRLLNAWRDRTHLSVHPSAKPAWR